MKLFIGTLNTEPQAEHGTSSQCQILSAFLMQIGDHRCHLAQAVERCLLEINYSAVFLVWMNMETCAVMMASVGVCVCV